MSRNVWNRSIVVTWILSNNMKSPSPKCYMTFKGIPICSENFHYTSFVIFSRTGPYYRIWHFTWLCKVSIDNLERVWHANRRHLLLPAPGPVPFLCFACVLILRPISPKLVLFVSELLSFQQAFELLFFFVSGIFYYVFEGKSDHFLPVCILA